MKMIIAIIRPEQLQNVKNALKSKGEFGMTITNVRGHGEQTGVKITTRVGEYIVDEIDKVKMELVVRDEDVNPIIDTILSSARTGHIGDGRIFVIPVERSIKIRTGEE